MWIRGPGLQASGVDWSWHGGTHGAGKQEAEQRWRFLLKPTKARAKTPNILEKRFKKTLNIAALCSYHMGRDNLAPRWWRDHVDKAGG